MHLPFLQITNEVIDQVAPDLAAMLEWTEEGAGWGLLKAIRWGLGRCPDDAPPSSNATVQGPHAAKLIARAAGYRGDPEAFVDACEQVRPAVLERVQDGVRFRGFDRYDVAWHNAESRSNAARAAANARWNKRDASATDAPRMPDASPTHPSDVPQNAKTQTQTQTQTQEKETKIPLSTSSTSLGFQLEPSAPPVPDPVVEVFEHWARRTGHSRAKLDDRRQKAIQAALDLGYSPTDLKQAVDGCVVTPHNMGQNDRGTKYDDLTLIFRDADHVDRFMRNATNPPKPAVRDKAAVAERVRSWDGIGPGGGAPPPEFWERAQAEAPVCDPTRFDRPELDGVASG